MMRIRRGAMGVSALALCALAPVSQAQTVFVEGFNNGSNRGGWTYGIPQIEVIEPTGGNPAWWVHSTCSGLDCLDTVALQARTTDTTSIFTGDWRNRQMQSVGFDAILVFSDFPSGGRPMSVVLSNSLGESVYFISAQPTPEVGDGWRSFDFVIPSQSVTLPPGWGVMPDDLPPDAAWNRTITDVAEVKFFWGDPTGFFIFQQWEPGMDNARFTQGVTIPPPCPPDWNGDDVVNSQDFFDFLADFFAGAADFNGDGTTNSQDFFDFLAAFFVGC